VDEPVNPYESPRIESGPEGPSSPLSTYGPEKRRLLFWLLGVMAIAGALAGISPDSGTERIITFLSNIAVAILITRWCEYDSREHGVRLWSYFVIMMICCPGPLFLVPIYLFTSRGSGGWLATLKAAGFLLAMIAVNLICDLAAALAVGNEFLSEPL